MADPKNYISTLTHNGVTYTFEDTEAKESIAALADIASSGSWNDLSDTPTTLSGYGITDAYTKTEIDGKIASSFHYKGSVNTYDQLPTSGNVTGDVWNVATADTTHGIKAGDNVCWDGTNWDILAGVTDLSVYDNHIANTSNPHNVTKAQVGLGNVENYSPANMPLSDAAIAANEELASDISTVDGKVDDHIANTSNPHSVTKAQVGLGNVDNTSDLDKPISTATQTALDGKVDKVTSTSSKNRFYVISPAGNQTTLDGEQTGQTAGTVAIRTNSGTIRTATPSDNNDATTKKYVDDADALKVDKVSTASRVYGTDSTGAQTTYDFNALGKVDDVKVAGTSVVTNKIANLGSMASETAADYSTKAVADTLYAAKSLEGDVSDLDLALSQEVQRATDRETALNTKIEAETTRATGVEQTLDSTKADKATTYTKTEVDGMLSGAMHFKGAVATIADLNNIQNPSVGDLYNVSETGANYAWDGTQWVKMAENVDLSSYALTSYVDAQDQAETSARQAADALKVDKVTTPSRVYGTDELGQPITYGVALFGNIDDVTVGGTSVVVNRVAPLGSMAGETASDYYTKTVADTTFADIEVETTKVDKVSTANRLYGTDGQGNQTTYEIQESETTPTTIGTMAFETASDYYKKIDLADIATSGSWNDLVDTPTTIAGYGITDAYTKSEIDGKIASSFHYKGTKTTYSQLPTSGNVTGDVWNIEQADTTHGIKAGDNVCWNGTSWDVLAGVTDLSIYDAHIANTSNPHNVTKAQVGLGNVDNTSDLNKPISTATQTALDEISGDISDVDTKVDNHIADKSNPHSVTKAQVGLGNVDNTSDLNKPISTATQTALNSKVDKVSTASRVYGTDSTGAQTTYDFNALGKVDDVKVNGTSVVTIKVANITLGTMASETASDYSTKAVADTLYAAKSLETTVSTHLSASNPHNITKSTVGLGNVDNTSDLNKPVSTAQQTAIDAKVDKVTTLNRVYGTDGEGNQTTYSKDSFGKVDDVKVGTTSVVTNKIATLGTMAGETAANYSTKAVADTLYAAKSLETTVSNHTGNTSNPHNVTKAQVGLGNVDNTSDLNKPISTATQAALDDKADADDLTSHTGNTSNPHNVTKAQVGLGNVDNTSDLNKPISTATQTALNAKQDKLTAGTNITINSNTISTPAAKVTFNDSGTETSVTELKINKLTQAEYDAITPSDTELYYITDADAITIDSALSSTSTNPVQNKVINTALNTKANQSDLTSHTGNTSNPHNVTKAQVGLGNVDNTSDLSKPISTATQTALDNKVSKVTTASKVYGTDASGNQTTYNVNAFGNVDDVTVGGTSVVTNKVAALGTMASETASNYYTKTDTYSKDEVDDLIEDFASVIIRDWSV